MPPATNTAEPTTYTDADYQPWLERDPTRVERATRVLTIWAWDHLYRLRGFGREHLPETGAYLLAPNHSSYVDPFVLARPQKRRFRYMAKSTMFEKPFMRGYLKGVGAFPIRRGKGDVFAMELARRLLADGAAVVVFPEGTRYRQSLELGPPRRGFARLALESKVPVVPAALWGIKRRELYGRRRWQRPKATVIYGEPMDFSHLELNAENVELVRDEVWAKVGELYEQARELTEQR